MDAACRRLNPLPFACAMPFVGPKSGQSPKADNLLKTKGNFSAFSLPKAENILKIKGLCKPQIGDLGMANRSLTAAGPGS